MACWCRVLLGRFNRESAVACETLQISFLSSGDRESVRLDLINVQGDKVLEVRAMHTVSIRPAGCIFGALESLKPLLRPVVCVCAPASCRV